MPALTAKQEKLLNHINDIGRLMDDEEALDYYVENHMQNDPKCYFNQYGYWGARERGENPKRKDFYEDYTYNDMMFKSRQWHKLAIGHLVVRGYLELKINNGFVKFIPGKHK